MLVRKIVLNEKNLNVLNYLEQICFPETKNGSTIIRNKKLAHWWIAYDNNNEPKAFGGAKIQKHNKGVYLCLSGVLPEARGQGIQKKLIQARIKWARKQNVPAVHTYTAPFNLASSNNLISCGFKLFEPNTKWGLKDSLYWVKYLNK